MVGVAARGDDILDEERIAKMRRDASAMRAGEINFTVYGFSFDGLWHEREADRMDLVADEWEAEMAAGLPLGYYERLRVEAKRIADEAEEATRERRARWGRRLQRVVERPVLAVVGLVNRLGGDMSYGDEGW